MPILATKKHRNTNTTNQEKRNIQNHRPKKTTNYRAKPTNTSKKTIIPNGKKNKFDTLCCLKNKTDNANKSKQNKQLKSIKT
ncbi:TPA: hypothetical protein ACI8B9_004617 [Escherichia coli]